MAELDSLAMISPSDLFDQLYSDPLLGYCILVNPLRLDPQAYIYETFAGFKLADYGVTPEDVKLRAASVFAHYDLQGTGRVPFKHLHPMLFEFVNGDGCCFLRGMDVMWLARQFDQGGRGEVTLLDFEMMLESLGGQPLEGWMVSQFRRNADVYGDQWHAMFRNYG